MVLARTWSVAGVLATALAVFPGAARAHDSEALVLERATAAIRSAPREADPWIRRAELHLTRADWGRARADLDRAASLAPERREIDLLRALCSLQTGRASEADALLVRFLATQPRHAGAHAARGRALAALGRRAESAQEFTAAIAVDPSPDLYLERARVWAAAGRADLAIAGLDEGLARLGPLPALENEAIELERQAGRTGSAIARIDRMIARSGHPEALLIRRAEIFERLDRREEAKASFARALVAMHQQPTHRRATPALRRLEAEAHAGLARLAEQAP